MNIHVTSEQMDGLVKHLDRSGDNRIDLKYNMFNLRHFKVLILIFFVFKANY